MKHDHNTLNTMAASLLAGCCLVGTAYSASYSYILAADNDFTLYTANGTGPSTTGLVEHIQQTTDWSIPISGSFSSSSNYIYVVGMNHSGQRGSFGGFINGKDISTVIWERSTIDVSSSFSGYLSPSPAYNPDIAVVSSLLTSVSFSGPAPLANDLTGVGVSGVANALDILGVGFPFEPNAYIFRTQASNFTVPEPSSAALLGLGGLALILRRRRA